MIQPAGDVPAPLVHAAASEPLADTGLFVVDAPDPRTLVEESPGIAWAAPVSVEEGEESYPTGELSIRFTHPLGSSDLSTFVERFGLEFRRRSEFVPEQVVVAPAQPLRTWLPELVDQLNGEEVVEHVWPNMLSYFHRLKIGDTDRSAASLKIHASRRP